MLERNPSLKPEEVRAILMKTARDLGAPGRDDLFGAGEADAFAAVSAATAAPGVPVAAASDRPAAENAGIGRSPGDPGVEPACGPPWRRTKSAVVRPTARRNRFSGFKIPAKKLKKFVGRLNGS